MVQDVSEEEMNSLTQSILIRYGIDFTCYEPKSLRRRIIRVMNNFNVLSVHELWVQFLRDKNFVHVFMNEISVGMTSMFRDPVLWRKLRTLLSTQHKNKTVSVWHAGCSTGEEVYSLGIVLKETQTHAQAFASDFNQNALGEAQLGVYHKIKMIENENNYREYNPFQNFNQYYKPDGKNILMENDLIKHVRFSYHNLVTDPFPNGFDIVFCRNVMIYFDSRAKTKILDQFYDSLNPGGWLIIGFFDTMSHLIDNKKFELLDEQAKIFRKAG